MDYFAGLPYPRAFIFGVQNRQLYYLAQLPGFGIEVIEIPHIGHFQMYSISTALWVAMTDFLSRHGTAA